MTSIIIEPPQPWVVGLKKSEVKAEARTNPKINTRKAYWRNIKDVRYIQEDQEREFWVQGGYLTDGASVPRWAWSFAPAMSPYYLPAALGHDQLCDWRDPLQFPADWSHRFFYDAMIANEFPEWRAKIMYRAVLLGGPDW